MHIELFMSASESQSLENDFTNGVNLVLSCCNGDEDVELSIKCDGEKNIIPSFYIKREELIEAIKKLC